MDAGAENIKRIKLNDSLDISCSDELKTILLDALDSKADVVLQADAVEKADTAALQVLCAFFQDAATQKQNISWENPTEVLCRSASLIGVTNLLELAEPAA